MSRPAPRPARDTIMPTDLVATLEQLVADHPDQVVLRHPAGRRHATMTYRELAERVDRYLKALTRAGLRPGIRVCLLVPPGPELFGLFLALARLGAVPVFIDPGLARPVLRRCLDEVAPEAFIGIPLAHLGRVLLGWGRRTVRIPITVGRRWGWRGSTLDGLVAASASDPAPRPEPAPDAVAGLAFTSGSTGIPKAVEYRYRHLVAQINLVRDGLGMRPGQVWMSTFPVFALAGPAVRVEMVIPDMDPTRPAAQADPATLAAEIARFGVFGMIGSPALLDVLSRYCVERGTALPSLGAVVSMGGSLDPRTMDRMRRCLSPDALLYSAYGATECLPVSVIESRELDGARAGTERGAGTCVGRALPANTVRVIRIDDDPIRDWNDELLVPAGTVGEITVAGPSASERYEARPEQTALAKIREADRTVHRTGDLGWLDERGRLWLCGRKSQRVRTADGDLHPEQVEPIANTVAGVRRAALVGVGEAGRQVPVICVEADRGAGRSRRRRIRADLLDLLAGFEHTSGIRHVLFHPRFPVDVRHNSKIGRERLGRWAAGRLRGGLGDR